jgi:hypothetical protein
MEGKLPELWELGIVSAQQAIEDKAGCVQQLLKDAGIKDEDIKDWYWCTKCGGDCMQRSAAYKHRKKHAKWKEVDPERAVAELDRKYGMVVPLYKDIGAAVVSH